MFFFFSVEKNLVFWLYMGDVVVVVGI